eukprot:TRINITY_DN52998_c0_g2_i1.p1 TRINITY_DN52998_c0_g2~~TRINITY_DN52998_c0_g2_i1.p1  ORF type:complete len:245 (-),score=60.76 TRINITY_DN52998_c0_g2_i1:24-758(-)
MVMAAMLDEIEKSLKDQGLWSHNQMAVGAPLLRRKVVGTGGMDDDDDTEDDHEFALVDLSEITYVDDLVYHVEDPDAMKMLDKIGYVIKIVDTTANKFNMKLNYKPNKTAAVASLAGRRKADARLRLNGYLSEGMKVGNLTLPFVNDYVHLGSVFSRNGSDMVDIRRRGIITLQAIMDNAVTVLCKHHYELQVKKMFISLLVNSSLLYNCQVKTILSCSQMETLGKPYKRAIRCAPGKHQEFLT